MDDKQQASDEQDNVNLYFPELATSDMSKITSSKKKAKKNRSKKAKRKIIVRSFIAIVITLGIGASLFGVYSWYQSPQKVITDSILNILTAKSSIYSGTIQLDDNVAQDIKLSIDITAKQVSAEGSLNAKLTLATLGKTFVFYGDVLVDESGDLYLKIKDIVGIVEKYKSIMTLMSGTYFESSPFATSIDKLVSKINGTWIKISSDDMKQYSEDYAKSQACIKSVVKQYKDDGSVINEITEAYKKHQFIKVSEELGQKDGSLGYKLKTSGADMKSFMKDIRNTKIYKTLHACDDSFDINTNNVGNSDDGLYDGTIDLWVSDWSHNITKIVFSGGAEFTAKIIPKYNQEVKIVAPSPSTTLSQLQTDIQDFNTAMQNY